MYVRMCIKWICQLIFSFITGEGIWWEYDLNFREVVFFDRENCERQKPHLQHFRMWNMKMVEQKLGKNMTTIFKNSGYKNPQ